MKISFPALGVSLLATPVLAQGAPAKPTLWIIGDSTVRNQNEGDQGWGDPIQKLFDSDKIRIENRALGGRSSRTFLTQGLWAAVSKNLKPGDFVMMQFGHNDNGKPEGEPGKEGRASLPGNRENSRVIEAANGKKERVQSFGWYLRHFIADAKAKGATPIVLSMVPRNRWENGKVMRADARHGGWAKEAATQGGAIFVDLNEIIAQKYEEMGEETVGKLFPKEYTHTGPEGAELNARMVVKGLRALPQNPLAAYLKADAAQ